MGMDISPLAGAAQTQATHIGQDQGLEALRAKINPQERGKVKQAAEDFEALFLNIVLKSMRDTVQKSGLIDGGNAEQIYSSMLDDEYAKMMAGQRHTGLADNVEHFLLQAQANIKENAQPTTALEAAAVPAAGALPPAKQAGLKAYRAQAGQGLRAPEKQATIEHSVDPARLPIAP